MMTLSSIFVTALATLSIASPLLLSEIKRHSNPPEFNALLDGKCAPVILIFARGSIEPGNLGSLAGIPTCSALKNKLGPQNVLCQGVGGTYKASILSNFLPANTDQASIDEAYRLFVRASAQCPASQVVAGGYSQGTAVIDGSIQKLPESIKARVRGVVLFAFTRNVRDHGRIPHYPRERTMVICAPGDLVCDDTLLTLPVHFEYYRYADQAADFLAEKVSVPGGDAPGI